MTDEFKNARDEAAIAHCKSVSPLGWTIDMKDAFLAGYAYAQEEAEPLISDIHKKDLEYLTNKIAAEKAKNAELENDLSATVIARNANKELFMEAQERIAELEADGIRLGTEIARQSKRAMNNEHRADIIQQKLAAERAKNAELLAVLNMVDCRFQDVFSKNGKCMKCEVLHRHAAPADQKEGGA